MPIGPILLWGSDAPTRVVNDCLMLPRDIWKSSDDEMIWGGYWQPERLLSHMHCVSMFVVIT